MEKNATQYKLCFVFASKMIHKVQQLVTFCIVQYHFSMNLINLEEYYDCECMQILEGNQI